MYLFRVPSRLCLRPSFPGPPSVHPFFHSSIDHSFQSVFLMSSKKSIKHSFNQSTDHPSLPHRTAFISTSIHSILTSSWIYSFPSPFPHLFPCISINPSTHPSTHPVEKQKPISRPPTNGTTKKTHQKKNPPTKPTKPKQQTKPRKPKAIRWKHSSINQSTLLYCAKKKKKEWTANRTKNPQNRCLTHQSIHPLITHTNNQHEREKKSFTYIHTWFTPHPKKNSTTNSIFFSFLSSSWGLLLACWVLKE